MTLTHRSPILVLVRHCLGISHQAIPGSDFRNSTASLIKVSGGPDIDHVNIIATHFRSPYGFQKTFVSPLIVILLCFILSRLDLGKFSLSPPIPLDGTVLSFSFDLKSHPLGRLQSESRFSTMPSRSSSSASFQVCDATFNDQVIATRNALKTFTTISALHAPGPGRIAMAELVNITVRCTVL